jgi:phosphate starvation-inducible protein PhoH and related proteins
MTSSIVCASSMAVRAVVGKAVPRTASQTRYLEILRNQKPYIVLASGSAGTGKTFLATQVALEKLYARDIDRIIITRPAVTVDEQHGFLPGSLESKMEPYLRPVYDSLGKGVSRKELATLVKDKVIEIAPLAYMRGRTFENSWVIVDEAQNATRAQLLMVLTRIGDNCKMVLTGDPDQHDKEYHTSGLNDLIGRFKASDTKNDGMALVEFGREDVQRHEIIPYVLDLYR